MSDATRPTDDAEELTGFSAETLAVLAAEEADAADDE